MAALVTVLCGVAVTAALASAASSPPLAALKAYWADVDTGRYASAYDLLAPGAINLTSSQFVADEKANRIVQVQFRGAIATTTTATATVNVTLLRTIDLQDGCRLWNGSYTMAEQSGRWLIERSDIVPRPCVTSGRPLLAGPWGSYQEGYDSVEPRTIFNGGDPTGLVTGISWQSWGGAEAVGTGEGWYVGPTQAVVNGHKAPAKIVLFHLGTCHGQRAYDAIEWYFPGHGQTFSGGDYIDPCTGIYYMNGKPEIG